MLNQQQCEFVAIILNGDIQYALFYLVSFSTLGKL